MSQYFPKPHGPFDRDISVKIDFGNYATKAELKGPTGVDTSNLALKETHNLFKKWPWPFDGF